VARRAAARPRITATLNAAVATSDVPAVVRERIIAGWEDSGVRRSDRLKAEFIGEVAVELYGMLQRLLSRELDEENRDCFTALTDAVTAICASPPDFANALAALERTAAGEAARGISQAVSALQRGNAESADVACPVQSATMLTLFRALVLTCLFQCSCLITSELLGRPKTSSGWWINLFLSAHSWATGLGRVRVIRLDASKTLFCPASSDEFGT